MASDEKQKSQTSPYDNSLKHNFGEGKTVLLVEDDPTTTALVKNLLKEHAFEVLEAIHGKDAWFKLQPECKPCLIICDVLMPEMDGFNLYKQLRQNKETESIPVLIISSRRAMKDTFMSMGADEFMGKPLDSVQFLKTVHTLSERGQEIVSSGKKEEKKPTAEDNEKV